jgi:hypothetical protein
LECRSCAAWSAETNDVQKRPTAISFALAVTIQGKRDQSTGEQRSGTPIVPLESEFEVSSWNMARELIALKVGDSSQSLVTENVRRFSQETLDLMVEIYNAGYAAGHHDTVEGGFVQVQDQDKRTYHSECVEDLVCERLGVE